MPTLQLVQVLTVVLVSAFVSLPLAFLHLFLSDLLNAGLVQTAVLVVVQQPFALVPFGAVVPRFLVPTTALVYPPRVDQSALVHLLVKYRIVVGFVILRLSVPVLLVCLALR